MTQTRHSHVDVLIVGAGLSGIGAACHLIRECPSKTFAIVEARKALGGTWDLFRYPGIRSDSDMFTLGYDFRPWNQEKAVADGPSILSYIKGAAEESGIDNHIRFNRRVVSASWSTTDHQWAVAIKNSKTDQLEAITCSFLFLNTGYYRYDMGYTPEFEGFESFSGQIIHPQFWPEDFDETEKQIVVIGSGATAVTLVPHLAKNSAHVTLLQRSPTYIFTAQENDRLANRVRRILPTGIAYSVIRLKNIAISTLSYYLSRRYPGYIKGVLRKNLESQLPESFDIDTHFTPKYNPWDQRVCLDINGELLKAISAGSVSIVTERIKSFTSKGIALGSGKVLEADVIVTATGLILQVLGGISIDVDGAALDPGSMVSYRGMMFSSVPNLAFTTGYTNASWTLKADLVARYLCRLLNHMDNHHYSVCTPNSPDPSMETESSFNLSSGYVKRSQDQIPRQGVEKPWRLHQAYPLDFIDLRFGNLDDEVTFLTVE